VPEGGLHASPRPFSVSARDKVYFAQRFQLPYHWPPSNFGHPATIRLKVTHGLPDLRTQVITPEVVLAHAMVQAQVKVLNGGLSATPAETFAGALRLMEAHVQLRTALGLPTSPFVPTVAVYYGAVCYGVVRPDD
jgi:hypothetical protein